MRRIREILRLRYEEGMSARKIARCFAVSHSTVLELLRRFDESEWSWPLPDTMDDSTLENVLYPQPVSNETKDPVDFARVHAELRKKNVTLMLLWEEYRQSSSNPYGYSRFCESYREWAAAHEVTAPQRHKAGEKVFIDFAGHTVPVTDSSTGEVFQAQIFVAVLGASSYAYVEACRGQDVPSLIQAVCNALEYFGGAPEIIVPDNLKSAVTKPSRYEAEIQSSFEQLAEHYRLVVLPTRPRHPKNKPKVEKGVQDVETYILARIRNRNFFSLAELNGVLWDILEDFNNKPFQKMEGSRRSLFDSVDKPVLRPLPKERFMLAKWTVAKLQPNCHVQVDRSFYSAPYQLVGKRLDIRLTDHMVDIFHGGQCVATHVRSFTPGTYVTEPAHLHPRHQAVLNWSPEHFLKWAESIGPNTAEFIEGVFASSPS
ncbi:IS21 family transposase [Alicyclobacillus macrosporangiidus]|uniref:IS21 family transposase n=1 Tax=Alicyclobacillus macrosporangiidus TaxID=392015 RepID=UPI00069172CD|nr:IS21 family transposase [Alicyclobacillus macrosporangiidus]